LTAELCAEVAGTQSFDCVEVKTNAPATAIPRQMIATHPAAKPKKSQGDLDRTGLAEAG
jgi:hypothetical protein